MNLRTILLHLVRTVRRASLPQTDVPCMRFLRKKSTSLQLARIGEHDERRRHTRQSVTKACKIFHRPSRRYIPALTCDASLGGVLLSIDWPQFVGVGDEIDVFVSWSGDVIAAENRAKRGSVRRVPASSGRQLIAVEFDSSSEHLFANAA